MVGIEYGRFGNKSGHIPSRPRPSKPRQEICASLKWLCFLLNCLLLVLGVGVLTLGIYSCIKEPRPITAVEDVLLNISIVLIILGVFFSLIPFCGLFGSLRENSALLKTSVWCGTFLLVLLVVGTLGLFMLFYSDPNENVYINNVMTYAIQRYHLNGNMADVVDYFQDTLECCGIKSPAQGYRDWNQNDQLRCNETNAFPERCGVPFSCCKKPNHSEASLIASSRSLQCWQNALKRRPHELENDINVKGCILPLKQVFERNVIFAASAVAFLLIMGCLFVFMEYVLARQIEYQHFLLDREARRAERQRKREQRRAAKKAKDSVNTPEIEAYSEAQVPVPAPRKISKISQRSAEPQNLPKQKMTKEKSKEKEKVKEKNKEKSRDKSKDLKKLKPSSHMFNPNDRVAQWVLYQSDFVKTKPS